MSVSLVKRPVTADNAAGARILIGGRPVLVKSVTAGPRYGSVILVGLTVNGAEVARVFPAGTVVTPAPTGH